ncbi:MULTISPECIES: glycosyltransferase family 87 protein [unclassified Ruegeria]|uniref:glycosyltransferase family 87 protein n=1 Tax=unclassified Ruegeria TaxID=2625375 RepID=UPI001ADA1E4B|nr:MULTISPECIES: glycosyltransferase family 87 protein [unclassified Ruegeria]MBO9411844.1 DUF2029 domain-containing protein [Ruegeria sp. R8_1]MBO9415595.1 DUF2029 domain-containing protein [Ruegeria sp. R8_2]
MKSVFLRKSKKIMFKNNILDGGKKVAVALIWAGLAFFLLVFYLLNLTDGLEPGETGMLVGRDFLNLYTAGELLAADQYEVLFSPESYMLLIWENYGSGYSHHYWSYPPTMFLPASFFGIFDYSLALTIWHVFGVFLILLALNTLRLPWFWTPLVVLSPAGILNFIGGQNGNFTASFIVFAFAFAKRRPIIAGVSWAILTIKPHLGVLAVPMLIARRQWSVICAGSAVFLFILGVSVWAWGFEPWELFFTHTVDQQQRVLEEWGGLMLALVPTGFMQGRVLGLSADWAYRLHAVYAVVGILLAIRAWPKDAENVRLGLTWFVLSTFLILPYSFLYDLVIFQIVLALWHKDGGELFRSKRMDPDFFWVICWLSPVLSLVLVELTNLQVLPLLFAFLLWKLGNTRLS